MLGVINNLPVNFIIKECGSILIMVFNICIFYRISLRKSFVFSFSFIAILLVSDLITYIVYNKIYYIQDNSERFIGTFVTLLNKCVLLLIIILVKHFISKKYKNSFNNTSWVKLAVFPLLSIGLTGVLLKNRFTILFPDQKNILWIIICLLIAMNIYMFLFIQDIGQKNILEQEKYILEMDKKTQKALYESIENGLEKQRELSHEYKNHIVCIYTMLEQKNYDGAKEYLKRISGIMSHGMDKINTNHPVANAIINAKYQEAVEKGIVVVCKINDLSGITMEDSDIVLILSNILNNAIEACEKCAGKKFLKFKFVMEKGNLIISIKNSYNGIIIKKGGYFQTTKNNKNRAHGIGLSNTIKTIEKYKGFYNISYDDNEFHVFIDIPQINP